MFLFGRLSTATMPGGAIALRGLATFGAGILLMGGTAPTASAVAVETPYVIGDARTNAALLAPTGPA